MILTYADIFVGLSALILLKVIGALIRQQFFVYQSYRWFDPKPRPLPVAWIDRDPWPCKKRVAYRRLSKGDDEAHWSDLFGPVPVFSFLLLVLVSVYIEAGLVAYAHLTQ